MTRFRTLACLLVVFCCSITAIASLYIWNPAKRPPVSLTDALAIAEKTLGEEAASRYCTGVSLYGSKNGSSGKWNLLYWANDGSGKNVTVDMQGKADVNHWCGPTNHFQKAGRLESLEELKQQLEALFQRNKVVAKVVIENDILSVDYRTRDFLVYEMNAEGEYGEQQITMRGPKSEGIWLKARLTDEIDRRDYFYDHSMYWSGERGTYMTTKPSVYLAIDLRYGSKLGPGFAQDLRILFGEGTR